MKTIPYYFRHLPSVNLEGSSRPLRPSSASARQPPCQVLSVSWKLKKRSTDDTRYDTEICENTRLLKNTFPARKVFLYNIQEMLNIAEYECWEEIT